jgi:hypothetical protein
MGLKNPPLAILSKGRYFNDTYFVLLCLPAVGREEVAQRAGGGLLAQYN